MAGSRDPATLHPLIRPLYDEWLALCVEDGLDPLAYCFVRSLEDQARLWRTNRTWKQIQRGLERLRHHGLEAAARALLAVGPQPGSKGRKKTNALPGTSWHNPHELDGETGALAWDWVPMVGGKAMWRDAARYERGGELAESLGLTWSGRWTRFRETCHNQLDRVGDRKLTRWSLAKGDYA